MLKDAPAWDALVAAWRDGGVLAGSSAGAMVLCDPMVDPRGGAFTVGLGLLTGMAVIPSHDHWSEDAAHRTRKMSPPNLVLAGIDERTALIRSGDGAWQVEGAGQVVVFRGGEPSDLAALPADHLRPNQLLLVSLGLVSGYRARRCVAACARHLLVPGALRSLAPLPVTVPLPIPAPWGGTLNDPALPYQGRYEGDEDTRRKPAYHNGTAWAWQLPMLCEALDLAWESDPAARATALAWLGSIAPLLDTGCLGQLPEILDGDAPHAPRGCDAQAWSVSEALRVWMNLT